MNNIELYKGDCLQILKTIPDKCADIFICDLPYGQTACEWDNAINLNELWIQLKRIARNNKTPYFFFCTTRFGYDLIASNKEWFRYDLVIEKSKTIGHLNSSKMPMRNHEMLYLFYKNLPCFNKDKYHNPESQIEHKELQTTIYGNIKPYIQTNYDLKLPKSILKMENINSKKRNHPTEKTIDILEWILKYYSNEGDTCLDPTMGSGSTGVACKNLNRKFIGIEMNDQYFQIAKTRIEN